MDNENTEDPTQENITFLYKLVDGVAPKSYGLYTAKMAGLSIKVNIRNYKIIEKIIIFVKIVRRAFVASRFIDSTSEEFQAELKAKVV